MLSSLQIIIVIIIYSFIKNSTTSLDKMHREQDRKAQSALTTALMDKERHDELTTDLT